MRSALRTPTHLRRQRRTTQVPKRLGANLTPLIDLSFLLIVFFVLVARIASVERVPLNPPTPVDPASERPGDDSRVVLNILASAEDGYVLGTDRFRADAGGLSALRTRLVDVYRANPLARVNVRADRAARYDRVEPAMRMISAAAAEASFELSTTIQPRVNLVVLREAQGGSRATSPK